MERQRRRDVDAAEAQEIDIHNAAAKPVAALVAPKTAAIVLPVFDKRTSNQGSSSSSSSSKKRSAPLAVAPAAAAAAKDDSSTAEEAVVTGFSNSGKKLKTATITAGKNAQTETRLDAAWEQHFQDLLLFKKQFGHVNVSETKHKATPHYQLAVWVANQRRRFANRQQQQAAAAAAAAAAMGGGGNTNTNKRKYRKGTMTDEQVVKLASIGGFRFTNKHCDFDTRLEQMIQYKATHNDDTRVPVAFTEFDNLGRWVKKIKYERYTNTLSADRVARLDAIGFDWEKRCAPNGYGKNNINNNRATAANKGGGGGDGQPFCDA